MASVCISRDSALNNDVVGDCIEMLHEKRRAAREEGMQALIAALEGFIPADELDDRYFTVFDRCCASLRRKGSAREARLAYRALGLLALTVGAAADYSREILDNALPVLEETIQASASDAATLLTALDCLAAVTFAGARCPSDAAPSMGAIRGVIKLAGDEGKTSAEVLAAAVSAWTLLLATVGDSWKATMIPFHDLAKLLESDDPAVRMAAGSALAVCVETNLTRHASHEDMQALETKVSELADEASGQVADKNLAEQEVLFRQIVALMSHGECPDPEETTTSWSRRRGVLMVSTWARLVQLNFLKRFLGKGFLKHVQDNPLFREEDPSVAADEVDELPSGTKIKQQKRGREKQWSVAMRRDRDIGWEEKNSFSLIP